MNPNHRTWPVWLNHHPEREMTCPPSPFLRDLAEPLSFVESKSLLRTPVFSHAINSLSSRWRLLVVIASLLAPGLAARGGSAQLVSVRDPSVPALAGGNGDSGQTFPSPDDRYVLFSSKADNLVMMTNGDPIPLLIPASLNVYLRDRAGSTTALVSVDTNGTGGGDGDAYARGLSTNGQFALFESSAGNLLPGNTGKITQVYLRDMVNRKTVLVSTSTNGGFGNGNCSGSVMTPDGRYVAFVSAATNLFTGDSNGIPDVFVRDVRAGTTVLASVGAMAVSSTAGSRSAAPAITPDGRYVAFSSTATNLVPGVTTVGDIYVRDLQAQTTRWASAGARDALHAVFGLTDGVCFCQKISVDGSLVAYEASASNYLSAVGLVLRYSLQTGLTDTVNTNANAPVGPYEDMRTLDMTPDGRFVANVANADATGLNTLVCLWDALSGSNVVVSLDLSNAVPAAGASYAPAIDPTGRYIAFLSTSTNLATNTLTGDCHLYYRDLQTNSTLLLDADTNGLGTGVNSTMATVLSTDGRLVAFESADPNDLNHYFNVWLESLASNATELVSAQNPGFSFRSPDGPSLLFSTSVSADGRYVAFASDADNLVPNDTNGYRDIFVRDLVTGTTILASIGTNALPAMGHSSEPSLSSDGRFVAFSSTARNLVPGDDNAATDVFVRDLCNNTNVLVSVAEDDSGPGNTNSYSPTLSSDGRFVLFRSLAHNLTSDSITGGAENLFLRDLETSTTWALTTGAMASGAGSASMTPDGRYVAYVGHLSGVSGTNLYVWDAQAAQRVYTNTTPGLKRVSVSPELLT
jgi:Tol biopolymer transport system component